MKMNESVVKRDMSSRSNNGADVVLKNDAKLSQQTVASMFSPNFASRKSNLPRAAVMPMPCFSPVHMPGKCFFVHFYLYGWDSCFTFFIEREKKTCVCLENGRAGARTVTAFCASHHSLSSCLDNVHNRRWKCVSHLFHHHFVGVCVFLLLSVCVCFIITHSHLTKLIIIFAGPELLWFCIVFVIV